MGDGRRGGKVDAVAKRGLEGFDRPDASHGIASALFDLEMNLVILSDCYYRMIIALLLSFFLFRPSCPRTIVLWASSALHATTTAPLL